ncbi:transposase [Gynuella sunshinyii]|uniref:Transposase n=1 Tax=Gynuella sunshinyii YC6258 TaxID=1445510 RepID=A0A0C5VHN5_9GAMM|nr:transposase [Gynuella sunshinyii]AJQ94177.1 transposase [Gynuella sunshinyii YC6258]
MSKYGIVAPQGHKAFCQLIADIYDSAYASLSPRQASSGERFNSGSITKRGNHYVRKQLIHGARAIVSRYQGKHDALNQWVGQLLARRGFHKTCVALVARMARLAWILVARKEYYRAAV